MKTRREHAREKVGQYMAEYEFHAYELADLIGENDIPKKEELTKIMDDLEKKIDMWETELYDATIEENGSFTLGRSKAAQDRNPNFKKLEDLK